MQDHPHQARNGNSSTAEDGFFYSENRGEKIIVVKIMVYNNIQSESYPLHKGPGWSYV